MEQEKETDAPSSRPQDMVLSVLGFASQHAADGMVPALPSATFISVLSRTGIGEAATRATLNRMTHRGLLTRRKDGRTTVFAPTDEGERLVTQGRARLFNPAPFERPDDVWTVLSCPLPTRLRNARYHLLPRLAWAGFGPLQPNLWIAPGRIDVRPLLVDLLPAEDLDLAHAFQGSPSFPTPTAQLVARAWDLDVLRAAHDDFLTRWENAESDQANALPQLLLLTNDWSDLLRTDPGLPEKYLGPQWPAPRSTATYQRLHAELRSSVARQFASLP
ncbi:PaaX family transcriptional regulator [Streptomyces griseoruber]|nr:PaaX family transcriptional regulator C-terminal domain-containing protein [Streptomyces griseoruber]